MVFASCKPHKIFFDYPDNFTKGFFDSLEVVYNSKYKTNFKTFTKVHVYKATFKEVFVERDRMVTKTIYNANSGLDNLQLENIDTTTLKGDEQNLFLLILETDNDKLEILPAFYFSIKKRPNIKDNMHKETVTIAPIYMGAINLNPFDSNFQITGFTFQWKIAYIEKRKGLGFIFRTGERKNLEIENKSTFNYQFLSLNSKSNYPDSINIYKIIMKSDNNISAKQKLVFLMDSTFNYKNSMLFIKQNDINLNK